MVNNTNWPVLFCFIIFTHISKETVIQLFYTLKVQPLQPIPGPEIWVQVHRVSMAGTQAVERGDYSENIIGQFVTSIYIRSGSFIMGQVLQGRVGVICAMDTVNPENKDISWLA